MYGRAAALINGSSALTEVLLAARSGGTVTGPLRHRRPECFLVLRIMRHQSLHEILTEHRSRRQEQATRPWLLLMLGLWFRTSINCAANRPPDNEDNLFARSRAQPAETGRVGLAPIIISGSGLADTRIVRPPL
jgi:hypothetical protein